MRPQVDGSSPESGGGKTCFQQCPRRKCGDATRGGKPIPKSPPAASPGRYGSASSLQAISDRACTGAGNGWNARSSTDRRCKVQRRCSRKAADRRSEEHTSELQSLMRISYAVFCLKKKKKN